MLNKLIENYVLERNKVIKCRKMIFHNKCKYKQLLSSRPPTTN